MTQKTMPLLRWLLISFVSALLSIARAQAPADDPDATLDAARKQVETIERRLATKLSDAEVAEVRRTLLELGQRADAIATEQAPTLASAKARLSELGAAPPDGKEAPDVAEQRRALQKTNDLLDARVRLARLLALETGQMADRAGDLWRSRFRAQLFERADSILTPEFWQDLRSGWPRDTARLAQLRVQVVDAAGRTAGWIWAALLGLSLGSVALRAWLIRRLDRAVQERAPTGRVRRSLHGVARAAIALLVPGVVAYALVLGLTGDGAVGAPVRALLAGFVGLTCFVAYLVGLGDALLATRRPSWRLLPLPDDVATGLRWQPLVIGVIVFVGWLLQRLASVAQVNLATEVAINGLYAIAMGIATAHTVNRAGRLHREFQSAPAGDSSAARRPWWLTLVLFTAWAALVASVLGVLVGYVALGGFVTRQVIWITVLGLTAYLLNALIDDAFDAWLGTGARAAVADDASGIRPHASLRNQAMVLTSGALRLFVGLVALVLVLAPFGEGPGELLRRADLLREGISIGELQLKPAAVLQALLVFVLALAAVRVLRRWLVERYLPTTSFDDGMRSSLATLLGFLGTVVAFGFGLSAVGLALEKVAWIASALSVGIGFGLQAVVSNFVSGLILLAERPVKVGDWVALGGVEGDIRRINVRATEIQMGDRSTLIVPNSEFITKVVRNVTHDSPLGLVSIKLPMPLDTDVAKARDILLSAFQNHADVLDTPAPNVFIDGIDGGNVVFNANGFVSSPRQAYVVRSALLFEVLGALPAAGLPLWKRPSMVLREQTPTQGAAAVGALDMPVAGSTPAGA